MNIRQIHSETHEKVMYCDDPHSGLRAFIAIHDTTLGPALGGCRMWNYDSDEAALADALRLSAGMTAKAALAGVPFGGGKAVIMGDSRTDKTPELMRAFGRFVETLNGAYISGEDVGISPADMMEAARETRHVVGLPEGPFASGDPSPVTADLVVRCMKVAAAQIFDSADLTGKRVAVQGLGHVGFVVADLALAAGARIVAADPNAQAVDRARRCLNAGIVSPDEVHRTGADIFAPCALGGILNRQTIPEIRARIVCGSANNQLARPECAQDLQDRGITYCPDYFVNAGGLISVAREALRIEDEAWTCQKLDEAEHTFAALMTESRRSGLLLQKVADRRVSETLSRARAKDPDDRPIDTSAVRN